MGNPTEGQFKKCPIGSVDQCSFQLLTVLQSLTLVVERTIPEVPGNGSDVSRSGEETFPVFHHVHDHVHHKSRDGFPLRLL